MIYALRGRYVVRWRDAGGRQNARRFDDQASAEAFEAAIRRERSKRGES
jgi:hypothetical protein